MKGSKVMSSKSGMGAKAGGSGKMNTSMMPKKGSKVTVPDWNNAASPSNTFMKQKPGRSGTNARGVK